MSHDKSVALLALKDYESTTVPAICIDLNANKKLSKITVEGQRVDLRPETIALAPDGKTAVLSIVSSEVFHPKKYHASLCCIKIDILHALEIIFIGSKVSHFGSILK